MRYTTLFQRWFDIVRRRDIISTQEQRWKNVEMFAGRLKEKWIIEIAMNIDVILLLRFNNRIFTSGKYLRKTFFFQYYQITSEKQAAYPWQTHLAFFGHFWRFLVYALRHPQKMSFKLDTQESRKALTLWWKFVVNTPSPFAKVTQY